MSSERKNIKSETLTVWNRIGRGVWAVVWLLLYRPTPIFLHSWRRLLLRLFGARVGEKAHPYPSARIWAPWNLELGDAACLGRRVDCYCVDKIVIGNNAIVSQYTYLCSASHDYTRPDLPLISAPIIIGDNVWITAGVFVGPGVRIGDGAVVLARSVVVNDVDPWVVVAGNPAKLKKYRDLEG